MGGCKAAPADGSRAGIRQQRAAGAASPDGLALEAGAGDV